MVVLGLDGGDRDVRELPQGHGHGRRGGPARSAISATLVAPRARAKGSVGGAPVGPGSATPTGVGWVSARDAPRLSSGQARCSEPMFRTCPVRPSTTPPAWARITALAIHRRVRLVAGRGSALDGVNTWRVDANVDLAVGGGHGRALEGRPRPARAGLHVVVGVVRLSGRTRVEIVKAVDRTGRLRCIVDAVRSTWVEDDCDRSICG